jgi:hypothetical protein
VTAVTVSTPPADAVALTKRRLPHRERGVLSLLAIGAVALLWLALDTPGLKLVVPGFARDKSETPVIANVVLDRGNAHARQPVSAGRAKPTRHTRVVRRESSSPSRAAVVVSALEPTAVPAPRTRPAPTTQQPQIRVQEGAPSSGAASPPASVDPAAQLPVAVPPTVDQGVATAVSTVTTAIPPTSDVTGAAQQVTSTIPDVPTLP